MGCFMEIMIPRNISHQIIIADFLNGNLSLAEKKAEKTVNSLNSVFVFYLVCSCVYVDLSFPSNDFHYVGLIDSDFSFDDIVEQWVSDAEDKL